MNTNVTLGLYAGSFSPFHVGHMDIVRQSLQVFDEIVIAQGTNPAKNITSAYQLPSKFLSMFSSHISTRVYKTLLTDLIEELENEFFNVVLIRGLRNGADLEYEQNLITFLKDIHPKLSAVAFYCDPKFRHISSSSLRDIQKFSEQEYRKYIVD